MNIPNTITLGRIAFSPLLFFLIFLETIPARLLALVIFLVAALTDVYDGLLARRHQQVSDFGKLADPLADKFLLAAAFLAFYFKNEIALWMLVVVLGREVIITFFRHYAKGRGTIIAAGTLGKWKTAAQMIFIGAMLLKYLLISGEKAYGWDSALWHDWQLFHRGLIQVTLWAAVVLSLASLTQYLWRNRRVLVGESP